MRSWGCFFSMLACCSLEPFAQDTEPWIAEPLSDLNSRGDEVLIGWDGDELYFGRLGVQERTELGDQWFLAEREDFTAVRQMGWSDFAEPVSTALTANRFPEWSGLGEIQHAAVDAERGVMVLSVWMPDGQLDLFMAQKENDAWSIPQPLDELNSPEQEVFPNFHGGDLIFGSNRQGGKGGFDVYRSNRLDMYKSFARIGGQVNSSGDELAALPAGESDASGFYVSAVRMGGEGGVDLWWVGAREVTGDESPRATDIALELRYHREPLTGMTVRIAERGGPHVFHGDVDDLGRVILGPLVLDAAVEVRFESKKKRGDLPDGAICLVYERCETGECLDGFWKGWRRIRSYRLEGGKAFVFDMLPLDRLGRWRRPSESDASVLLGNFAPWVGRFETSRAVLAGNDQQELIEWLNSFRDQDGRWPEHLKLRIEGHTDGKGSPQANTVLSIQRANYAAGIASNLGVSPDRTEVVGFGDRHASGQSNMDRRVTVQWVSEME